MSDQSQEIVAAMGRLAPLPKDSVERYKKYAESGLTDEQCRAIESWFQDKKKLNINSLLNPFSVEEEP
jgi:hypothetical protein